MQSFDLKGRRDALCLVLLTINWAGMLQGFVHESQALIYRAVLVCSKRKEIGTYLAKGRVLKRLTAVLCKHDPFFQRKVAYPYQTPHGWQLPLLQ